ncbi:integrin beta-PS-like isoform X1 [Diorhabda carinulata]|uniref:integrin beta-PS-like isoform X1 n=2 Tax=Diorhabda carinulata TaxID=1163345 RepID=UPI0025A2EC59|nr:integrin beta-PS-like isoform X1 [Diorhabda carinulata]
MSILIVAYITINFINFSFTQSVNTTCEIKENCQECIQEYDCEWCIEPKFENVDGGAHCRSKSSTSKWCDESKLISPKMTIRTIEDEDFSDEEDRKIQMKPQRVKLSLRKGEKFDLRFKFQNAANYPVDLYYIMDLSKSMEKYKKNLAQLGIKLADTMRKITKDFLIGFGSFIDKVELPFVSTVPSKLKHPCKTDTGQCVSPYSFKNMLPLSRDYNSFVEKVKTANVSGNLDSPEGGFDAIMQAMVCKKKIKWRDQARHLLVFSTDAEFHIAGDGKLAGVIEPNPARCYEDDKEYLIYDYPSVSQINYVAKENNINIIFAIVKKTYIKSSYQLLSDIIENSKFGQLDEKDDDSVIKLIVDNYRKIVQSVKFTSNASEEIDVQFSSNCNGSVNSDRCSNVHVGQVIDFTATIQLRQCPENGERRKFISIRPESLNESLIVEVDLLCDCPCSKKSDETYEPNSPKCNEMGDLSCGVCSCSEGRFGKNCQCDKTQSQSENTTLCIKPGTTGICSGSGVCRCGKCECNAVANNPGEKFTGQYCECDNFSCKRIGGILCSGKGTCNCNKCECFKGFSGDDCKCDLSTTNCRSPDNDKICSGHGKCICNRCECEMQNNNRYSGKFCEECTSCPAQRCEELRPCVECQVYKAGIYKDVCDTNCTLFKTEKLRKFDIEENGEFKKCKILDINSCIINFEYSYTEDDKLIVKALDKKICPEPPNVLAWILGVIGAILIVGLLTLLMWKILTTIHDKREYAKFENEQKKLKWGRNDNPLYKGATTTFDNPGYHRNSVRYSLKKE